MSNPPIRNPLYIEEEDFSFPTIQAPNAPNNNPPLNEQIIHNSLPNTCLPMSNYQDLSTFLEHDIDQDFASIGQFPTTQETSDWVALAEQVGLDLVQQGAEGSSDGLEFQHRSIDHDHDQVEVEVGGIADFEDWSSVKKLAHNAKERVRRLKVNESYLALRSLLPDSKRAKEKWSAPYIIDRTLEYIPELQAEIEKLTLEKQNILSVIKEKKVLISDDKQNDKQSPTLSMNEVKRGELIIQICLQRDKVNYFSTLLKNLEIKGVHVIGASSVWACQDRSCFHLHVQITEVPEIPLEANYVEDLQKKLISWLS